MSEPAHGTYSRYVNRRCRCELCRAAKRAYVRAYRARPPAPRPTECAVCGAPLREVAPAGGRPPAYCSSHCQYVAGKKRCVCGALKTSRAVFCQRCFGVTVSERQRLLHAELHRRVEELWAAGLTLAEIAGELGWRPGSVASLFPGWRRMGLDLPYRRSPEVRAAVRAGQERSRLAREAA